MNFDSVEVQFLLDMLAKSHELLAANQELTTRAIEERGKFGPSQVIALSATAVAALAMIPHYVNLFRDRANLRLVGVVQGKDLIFDITNTGRRPANPQGIVAMKGFWIWKEWVAPPTKEVSAKALWFMSEHSRVLSENESIDPITFDISKLSPEDLEFFGHENLGVVDAAGRFYPMPKKSRIFLQAQLRTWEKEKDKANG